MFRRRPSFTLVELLVVVSLIILILAIVGPAMSTMWKQRYEAASTQQVKGMLEVARNRAMSHRKAYGVLFYVDKDAFQRAAFIISDSVPVPNCPPAVAMNESAYFNLTADRFRVDAQQTIYRFGGGWRVGYSELILKGVFRFDGDMRDLGLQQDYFVVIFSPDRQRDAVGIFVNNERVLTRYIISDADKDGDRIGDVTNMPLIDIEDRWTNLNGDVMLLNCDPIYNILDMDDDKKFDMQVDGFLNRWGVILYNYAEAKELQGDTNALMSYIKMESIPIYLTRHGDIVMGPRGEM